MEQTATQNDIGTLNDMIKEAESNPNSLDLQFFAKNAKEKLDILTRQQVRDEIMAETGLSEYDFRPS